MTGHGPVSPADMTMVIHTGMRDGGTKVVAHESPQAYHLFRVMTQTIADCLDEDALSQVPRANATIAAILGTAKMAAFHTAQGWWRYQRRIGARTQCHACDLNAGGYCDIIIDWHDCISTGTVCEPCAQALGLDGSDDDDVW